MGKKLPIHLPQVPDQKWSCHACTYCCKAPLVHHLTKSDRKKIGDQNWDARLDIAPTVRIGKAWALNQRDDGRCVFLEGDKCRIHQEFGADAKPLACRMFPFSVRRSDNATQPGRLQVSLRFDCPSMARSSGNPLTQQTPELERMRSELDEVLVPETESRNLQPGRPAGFMELHALTAMLLRHLGKADSSNLDATIRGLARLTTTLASARLDRIRDERFVELVGLLEDELPIESKRPTVEPARRAGAMFRQLAFAHTEQIQLEDTKAGPLARLGTRLGQLRRARTYLKGVGVTPPVKGVCGSTTFERVERVGLPDREVNDIAGLVQRYLSARLTADTVFGPGYFNWPVMHGINALWLSLAAAGFLARMIAAAEGDDGFDFQHVARAIGIVDRAATRAPALGSLAERTRVSYFLTNDALAGLLDHYRFIDEVVV